VLRVGRGTVCRALVEGRQKSVWIAKPRLAGGSNTRLAMSTRRAPYFLKVYGFSRPEVHGHALKCARLDIQPRRLEFEPGASRSRTVLVACPGVSFRLRRWALELNCGCLRVLP